MRHSFGVGVVDCLVRGILSEKRNQGDDGEMKPYGHSTCSSFGGTRLDLVEIADIAELHLLGNQDCYKSLKKSLRSFANRSSFFHRNVDV